MSNHRARTALAAILATAVATIAACVDPGATSSTTDSSAMTESGPQTEGSDTQAPSAGTSPSASPPTSGVGGTEPSPGGSTAGRTAGPVGEWDLVLADVRVAAHPGFDRIVLVFTGTGVPGWSVDYVDEAVVDGSGEGVPLRGEAVLDVYASGTTWSGEDQDEGARTGRRETGDAQAITDLHVVGTFEGYTQVLVGLRGEPVPFRVHTLEGPPRLVVDVDWVHAR